ncbi:MAG TPA: isochorismatase family protein [Actinophytocola sp.]|jgi:nicotinamidase-related amidase|uniref:isochorismatase family protein n=1 Tax=Actinophytocola sp. TaxID=1872138 RepID=UPI002F95565F
MTSLNLEATRTALIAIDLMPRIVDGDRAPHSGPEVRDRCVAITRALRAAGGLVVWVTVERPGEDPQPEGSGLAPECDPQPDDVRIVKRTWGAFHGTGLDEALRAKGIETVVMGGIATNFGVESTARAADEHDYRVVSVSDAMTGLHAHAHDFAVGYVFPRLGPVVTTEELLREL